MQAAFTRFLEEAAAKGGCETDDVLAALLPLMKQVLAAHEAGQVAPLDGIGDVTLSPEGCLAFDPAKTSPPERNTAKVEALQAAASRAVEVVAESRRTADIDQSSLTITDLSVGTADGPITKPVFLPDYRSWEKAI